MYEWDQHNLGKLASHSVTPEEAIEALEGLTYNDLPYQDHRGEFRFPVLGETKRGRVLRIIWTEGQEGNIRILTAFDAEPYERRIYRNEKRR